MLPSQLVFLLYLIRCTQSFSFTTLNNGSYSYYSYICNSSYPCTNLTMKCGFQSPTPLNPNLINDSFANAILPDNIDYTYDCNILCDGAKSCMNSRLDCGYSNQCNIFCNETNSCANVTIFGNYTNYLNWTCYVTWTWGGGECSAGGSVFCPIPDILRTEMNSTDTNQIFSSNYPTTTDEEFDVNGSDIITNYKNCEIYCKAKGRQKQCNNFTLYSIEGMSVMKIDHFYGGMPYMKNVTIYCGEHFEYLCHYGLYLYTSVVCVHPMHF